MNEALQRKQIFLRNQHEAAQSVNRFHLRELQKLKDEVIEKQRSLQLTKEQLPKGTRSEEVMDTEDWLYTNKPSTPQLMREVNELLAERPRAIRPVGEGFTASNYMRLERPVGDYHRPYVPHRYYTRYNPSLSYNQ